MTGVIKRDSASCALLLAVARHGAGGDAEAVGHAAEGVLDWEEFLSLAQLHRMGSLVWRCLENCEDAIPASVRQRLKAEYERNLCHSLLSAAELLQVLQALSQEQIAAMPLKGVVLGASAYGEFGLRTCGDLDLLIRRKDLESATEILVQRGFRRAPEKRDGSPVHERSFLRPQDGMVLELRWNLDSVSRRYTRELGLDWVWHDRRSVPLAGARVPDASPEKSLIMLCTHGSKHVWHRLIWVCDVSRLIASSPELDWRVVETQARLLGLWKPVCLGLLLANRLAGPIPKCPPLLSAQDNGTVLELAEHFAKNLVPTPGMLPGGLVPCSVRMLDFRDRVRLFFSMCLSMGRN